MAEENRADLETRLAALESEKKARNDILTVQAFLRAGVAIVAFVVAVFTDLSGHALPDQVWDSVVFIVVWYLGTESVLKWKQAHSSKNNKY